jgi:hypothetical protein
MRSTHGTTLPLCLLAGALLTVAAGAAHPHLDGDGAHQLATIGATGLWRTIHWAFLFSFPLALVGLAGLVGRHVGTAGESAARAGLTVAAFAYAAWAVIAAFMAGAGWALARRYVVAEPGPSATGVILLYETIHPFGLAAQRTAGFALGVATYLFGRAALRGGVLPRWLGLGGIGAGVAAIVLALFFREDTMADQAAFLLPVLWQVTTGIVLLGALPAPSRPG